MSKKTYMGKRLTGLLLLSALISTAQSLKVDRSNTEATALATDSKVSTVLTMGSSSITIFEDGNCGLSLSLAGKVTVNQNITSISYPGDLDDICKASGIHIVDNIAVCGQDDSPNSFAGCALPGCAVVTWTNSRLLDQSLWMHEYGHAKCLHHNDGTDFLMNSTLFPNQVLVSKLECKKLLLPTCSQSPSPKAKATSKEPIETFIARRYIHGLPFEKAKSYTPQDVAKVIPWLKPCRPEDKACKLCDNNECWANIVMLIGLAGSLDEQSREALVDFLKLPVSDLNAYQAKLAVPLALGYLIHRPPTTQGPHAALEPAGTVRINVLQFLGAGAHFQSWKGIGAKLDPGDLNDEGAMELAKQSILGLGVSGTPEADETLHQLSLCNDPNKHLDGCDEFLRKESTQNLINYGRNLNAQQNQQKNAR